LVVLVAFDHFLEQVDEEGRQVDPVGLQNPDSGTDLLVSQRIM
jgi:hypothetical protein